MLSISKLLCRNSKFLLAVQNYGSVKDAGGKWAERQAAHEGEYFHKKNQEFVEYIKEELKKGRTIEDVVEDTRKELQAREARRSKGIHEDDEY